MKPAFCLLLCLGSSILSLTADEEVSIEDCPEIGWDFKISPYLSLAQELQREEHAVAVGRLREWASTGKLEDQIFILCRMLFTPRAGNTFRRPRIGGAHFLGDTDYKDWALEPIAVHRNVPILITYGYSLAGRAESSLSYLDECTSMCDPTKVRFKALDAQRVAAIVDDWLTRQKWTDGLSERDRAFFTNQAEPDGADQAANAPASNR